MKEYEKALMSYIEATNSHKFDNVEKCLSSNAVYFFSDKKCQSTKDIRSYFENAWNIIVNEKYEVSEVEWIIVTEEVATCIYNYKYSGFIENKFVEGGGKATNIFVKENSNWLLLHEHLSN
ncbi:YybH family protein [Enterococcus sp. LJL99]